MILLLTLANAENDKLLLCYNTVNEKGYYINNRTYSLCPNVVSTSGIVYSGDHLCFGIQSANNELDRIAIYNIYEKQYSIFKCQCSKGIGSMISVYPGKIYFDSYETNSISSANFDWNLSQFSDSVHYALDEKKLYGLHSLCSHNSTWFVAQQDLRRIVDLTHDRIVFSDIDTPRCLFFNYNHRLCFIEQGKNLFHFGDFIVHVGDNPTAAIEDRQKGGYWVACEDKLQLIDYDGDFVDSRDLSKWGKTFNNIIEAEGNFA